MEKKPDEKAQRTKLQNRALHKWFQQASEALMNEGLTVEGVFAGEIELMPTPEVLKEVWRQVMYKQTGKTSTAEMTTDDVDRVYDVLNLKMGQKAGIHVPWPSLEELSLQRTYGEGK